MVDTEQEKNLASKIMEVTNYLRSQGDLMAEETKKFGVATAESTAAAETANKRIDELELKLQKIAIVKPGVSEPKNEKAAAQRSAFFNWMRGGVKGLEPQERKALVSDTTGGYLIPEDIEAEIIRAVPQLNVFRKLASATTTTRDKLRKRTLTEVSMGWGKVETGTDITESTLTPATDYIYAEDLYGLTKVGEDELMDTDANLAAIIADSFSVARADAEEAAFAIGTGHTYGQPCGLAVDSTLCTGVTAGGGPALYVTYAKFWATDDTVLWDDMFGAEYHLPAQYLPGASWLMNRTTEAAIRVLKAATSNAYYWQPSLVAGMPNTIDGFPVYNNNSLQYPADTLTGINVIFGNFKLGYRIVDRLGMSIQRLDELYAEAGLIGFKAHFRVGGDVIRQKAFFCVANDAT